MMSIPINLINQKINVKEILFKHFDVDRHLLTAKAQRTEGQLLRVRVM
jgi:hypothetical protein